MDNEKIQQYQNMTIKLLNIELKESCKRGDLITTQYLLEKTNLLKNIIPTSKCFYQAILSGNADLVTYLYQTINIKKYVHLKSIDKILIEGCQKNNINIIEIIMKNNGFDLWDNKKETLSLGLSQAIIHDSVEVVKYLLENDYAKLDLALNEPNNMIRAGFNYDSIHIIEYIYHLTPWKNNIEKNHFVNRALLDACANAANQTIDWILKDKERSQEIKTSFYETPYDYNYKSGNFLEMAVNTFPETETIYHLLEFNQFSHQHILEQVFELAYKMNKHLLIQHLILELGIEQTDTIKKIIILEEVEGTITLLNGQLRNLTKEIAKEELNQMILELFMKQELNKKLNTELEHHSEKQSKSKL